MAEPVTTAAATSPWWGPALIAGGAALAQGVGSTLFGAHSAKQQMRFQREMSNTAHEREVRDLKRAGLNPILSAKYGGSSTPPGASSQASGPDIAHSALSAMQAKSQINLQNAQANQANSAANLSEAQAATVTGTLPGQIKKIDQEINSLVADQGLKNSQANAIKTQVQQYEATIRNLNAQTETEKVKLQKEKATELLWRRIGQAIQGLDKVVRWELMRKLKTILKFTGEERR